MSFLVAVAVTVAACGGGGTDGGPNVSTAPATVSTLAYVVSECRAVGPFDQQSGTIRQQLRIRQGEQPPITVVDTSAVAFPIAPLFRCIEYGYNRRGWGFWGDGVFRRLGVTPDGSQVVYEVTDDGTQTAFPPDALPAEQEGIFVVNADGNGRRRLAPASREPPFTALVALNTFAFSPDGRTVAYTDRGPSRDNEDAAQIFTIDLATEGAGSVQITQLPPGETCCPFFEDDKTITFSTRANADGMHPDGDNVVATVQTDGTGLTVAPLPVAIPGSEVDRTFHITGSGVTAVVIRLPGEPVNPGGPDGGQTQIKEVFVVDGEDVLQLTNFGRDDTWQAVLSADQQRVFFPAAVDRLGTNPTENCQIFSIDRQGGDLRQLTNFQDGPHSEYGCHHGPRGIGCVAGVLGRDTRTDAIVFYSTCDPFGTNPNGGQIFAMHPDGTGLRQLTDTQGYDRIANDSVTVELPFPFAYPGQIN